jgi:hypothetical protein
MLAIHKIQMYQLGILLPLSYKTFLHITTLTKQKVIPDIVVVHNKDDVFQLRGDSYK